MHVYYCSHHLLNICFNCIVRSSHATMASSYFDEHDCEPLKDGQQPNHQLHLARLLIDGGHFADFDFAHGDGKPGPPASKAVVKSLVTIPITPDIEEKGESCAICMGPYESGQTARQMPCDHKFHNSCIMPWLERTNTCPFCRQELPTDDPDYEEFRKHKARAKQREYELESLHDSMFG